MEPRLIDVIWSLKQQGHYDEAEKLKADILFELFSLHGLDGHSILRMTMNEIEGWYQKPPKPMKYEGWDNFYWGQAINADHRERNG